RSGPAYTHPVRPDPAAPTRRRPASPSRPRRTNFLSLALTQLRIRGESTPATRSLRVLPCSGGGGVAPVLGEVRHWRTRRSGAGSSASPGLGRRGVVSEPATM